MVESGLICVKMGHTKQFCRIPRWVHTHADMQSRKHTLTTHVEKHALTTPAAAESNGDGVVCNRSESDTFQLLFLVTGTLDYL